MANLGKFTNLGAATASFILDHLEWISVQINGPKSYKITTEFSGFLQAGGLAELLANDVAEKQRGFIWDKLRSQIDRWNGQGVVPPYLEDPEIEDLLVTWRHSRYGSIAGYRPMSSDFFEIYNWLRQQKDSLFILPCSCYLRAIGCDPIFVTDGAGDEGIDCIGVISQGPLCGTVIFVQAKSSTSLLSTDELLQEYSKFVGMRRTARYMDYLNALGIQRNRTGAADVYMLVTNSDLKHGSAGAAQKLGGLVRSRRQVAKTLSEKFSLSELIRLSADTRIPKKSDLTFNMVPMLASPPLLGEGLS